VRSLGVDVGVGKGLDLVLMDERRVPLHVASHVRVAEIGRLLGELKPDVVAIDSPPRWASSGKSRRTERELAALNIQSFNTPSESHGHGNRFFAWMEVGFAVFAEAASAGYRIFGGGNPRKTAMEVFPHASAVVLAGALSPKGVRKRTWRDGVLRSQGVRTDELGSLDQIDAALGALTGLLVLEGKRFAPGEPQEGVIVLPAASLPAHPYRRAVATPDGSEPLFNYCACGNPSCQELVRGEFAHGHDAKRKAMLWQRARDGAEAIDELKRRSWQLPPEMR
jgi:predicted nuclease with RNAse H fold